MIEGVYYTSSKLWIGTGATKRKSISKRYWYAREVFNEQVEVQLLTRNLTPVGEKRFVDLAQFAQDYVLDPDLMVAYVTSTSGTAGQKDGGQSTTGRRSAGTSDFTHPVPVAAEQIATPQAKRAELRKEQAKCAEHFEKGLTLLKRGYADRAKQILSALPEKEIAWEYEHKHMFNGFGKTLRKRNEPEIALKHYLKAAELSPEDDHLAYNIARVYYDLGKIADCKRWLQRALGVNPQLSPALQFLKVLEK